VELGKLWVLNHDGEMSIVNDTNIFTDARETGDLLAKYKGAIELSRKQGLIHGSARAGYVITRYQENRSEDTEDPYANITVSLPNNIETKSFLKFTGTYSQQTSPAREVNVAQNAIIRSESLGTGVSARYDFSSITGIGASVNYNKQNSLTGLSDIETGNYMLSLIYLYSPTLDIDLSYSYSRTDVDVPSIQNTPSVNSQNHNISIGVRGQLTPVVSSQSSIGYSIQDLDHSSGKAPATVVTSTELTWKATDKPILGFSSATIRLSRDFSTTQGNESIITNNAGFYPSMKFFDRFSIRPSVTYSYSEFRKNEGAQVSKNTQALTGAINLGYSLVKNPDAFLKKSDVSLGYSYTDNKSSVPGDGNNGKQLITFQYNYGF
jgi:hypothetical protein